VSATVYRLRFVHLSEAGEDVVIRDHQFGSEGRYLAVPRRCPDCLGEPCTFEPPAGFQACLMLLHNFGCPAFGRALRADAGGTG
jgi:ribosomal protein S27E